MEANEFTANAVYSFHSPRVSRTGPSRARSAAPRRQGSRGMSFAASTSSSQSVCSPPSNPAAVRCGRGASHGQGTSYSTVRFERICLMSVGPASKPSGFLPLLVATTIAFVPGSLSAETLEIGIGTQNTTTNTVTGGIVLKELGLLEKHLPKTGKYKDIQYKFNWQNATSAP